MKSRSFLIGSALIQIIFSIHIGHAQVQVEDRMRELEKRGGRFIIGTTSEPATFNPLKCSESIGSNNICRILYSTLVEQNLQKGGFIGALAKSWDIDESKKTITFHLRDGAKFSNGEPILAEDVAFSYEMSATITEASSHSDILVDEKPAIVRVLNEDTIEFKLHRLSRSFLIGLSELYIVPKQDDDPTQMLEDEFEKHKNPPKEGFHIFQAYTLNTPPDELVTSGPFRLKGYSTEYIRLERNPFWFRVDRKGVPLPYLDEITFRLLKDQETAVMAMTSGKVDALDLLSPKSYIEFEKLAGITLHNLGQTNLGDYITFNLNRERKLVGGKETWIPSVGEVKYRWFRDVRFRRAISMAIDRDSLIRGPLSGYGKKSNSLVSESHAAWFDPSIRSLDYNPEAARRLLAEMKFKDRNGNGIIEDEFGNEAVLSLTYRVDITIRRDESVLIQDDFAKIGIKLLINPIDFTTLMEKLKRTHQFELILAGFGGSSDPVVGGYDIYKSSRDDHMWSQNQPTPGTPEEAKMDELLELNLKELDAQSETSKRTWRELNNILNDQCFMIWMPKPIAKLPVRNVFGNLMPRIFEQRLLWNSDMIFDRRIIGH